MFRKLSGESREPTWAERQHLDELRAAGISDVYIPPEQAPQAFWNGLIIATHQFLAAVDAGDWDRWADEIRWAFGWQGFRAYPGYAYVSIVQSGTVELVTGNFAADLPTRLSAIEHALDVVGSARSFCEAVNEKARWSRVGLRLEGSRFVPVASEHLHQEVVQPTLLLLSDERLSAVDALYRKGFERMLSGDPSGAVTNATAAIEEMLRLMLGQSGGVLDTLAKQARSGGLLSAAIFQLVTKLGALRPESDAHSAGTEEQATGALALNVAASVLLYLAATPWSD